MNIDEFNEKIVVIGKETLGDRYSFASSHIQSMMYGHICDRTVTYRAVVFYDSNIPVDAESIDINLVFEMLEAKCKALIAKQSNIEL